MATAHQECTSVPKYASATTDSNTKSFLSTEHKVGSGVQSNVRCCMLQHLLACSMRRFRSHSTSIQTNERRIIPVSRSHFRKKWSPIGIEILNRDQLPPTACATTCIGHSTITARSTSVMLTGDEDSLHALIVLSYNCSDSRARSQVRSDALTNFGCILNHLSKILSVSQHRMRWRKTAILALR